MSSPVPSHLFERHHGHTVELEDGEDFFGSENQDNLEDGGRNHSSSGAVGTPLADAASSTGGDRPLAWPSPTQLESRAMLMGTQGVALWSQLEQTLNDQFVAQLQERIQSFRTGILILLGSKRKRVGTHGQTILTFLQSELDNAEGLVEERLSQIHLSFRDRLRDLIQEWEEQCDDHIDEMQQEILVRVYPLPSVRPASACSSHSPSSNNHLTRSCSMSPPTVQTRHSTPSVPHPTPSLSASGSPSSQSRS